MEKSKIIEYKIITAFNYAALAVQINEEISRGWQPYYGPVVTTPVGSSSLYCQAMVKYEVKTYQDLGPK